jgi:hypothetical protein
VSAPWRIGLRLVSGVLCMVSAIAIAHHSTAMFEWGKEKTLEGTVVKWEWTQPHTFLWVLAQGQEATAAKFALEGMSPSWLGRRGWGNKSFAPGDKVKLVYYPLKDGRNGGFYVRVTLPGGRTLDALPQRAP